MIKELESYFFVRLLAANFMLSKELKPKCVHPLTGIPNRFRKEFFELIGHDNKKKVFEAIDYYMDNRVG
jgi:hypothetical protein